MHAHTHTHTHAHTHTHTHTLFPKIGCRFWDLALREHAQYNKVLVNTHIYATMLRVLLINMQTGVYDEALSSFFRNTETRYICTLYYLVNEL